MSEADNNGLTIDEKAILEGVVLQLRQMAHNQGVYPTFLTALRVTRYRAKEEMPENTNLLDAYDRVINFFERKPNATISDLEKWVQKKKSGR